MGWDSWLFGQVGCFNFLAGTTDWVDWLIGWLLGSVRLCCLSGLVEKDSKDREDDPTTHNPIDMARRNARSD